MDEYSIINKWLYKKALNKMKYIYVRDEYSQLALEGIFNLKANLTYDVAFSINEFEPFDLKIKIPNDKKYLIGVTTYKRYAKYNNDLTLNQYYNKWSQFILKKLEQGKTVTLFYTTLDDYHVVKSIQNSLEEKHNISVEIAEIFDLESLIKVINDHDVVVSPRMHALILAKVYGKYVEPVLLSDKIESFSNYYLNDNYNQRKIIDHLKKDLQTILND